MSVLHGERCRQFQTWSSRGERKKNRGVTGRNRYRHFNSEVEGGDIDSHNKNYLFLLTTPEPCFSFFSRFPRKEDPCFHEDTVSDSFLALSLQTFSLFCMKFCVQLFFVSLKNKLLQESRVEWFFALSSLVSVPVSDSTPAVTDDPSLCVSSLISIVFSLLFFHVFLCLPFHCIPDKRRDPSFTVFLLLLLKRGRNFILRTKSSDRSQRKLMPKSIAREKRRFLSRVRIWKASKEGKLCCDGFFFPGV